MAKSDLSVQIINKCILFLIHVEFKLVIFDGKSGEKLGEISAHSGSILSLSWNPSSNLILTASGDKTAKIWNVDEKTLVK